MHALTDIQTFSKMLDGTTKIATNFRVSEFACHDGSNTILVDVEGVRKIQRVRDLFGKAISITSGYRTTSYNAKVGGAIGSYHVKGQAFDTVINGLRLGLIAKAYEVAGMGCTIIYQDDGFVHTDTRTNNYFAYDDGTSMSTNLQTCKFQGNNTSHIKDLQTALTILTGTKLDVDGIFGSKTLAAVKAFQQQNKLAVDGICGVQTWRRLLTA